MIKISEIIGKTFNGTTIKARTGPDSFQLECGGCFKVWEVGASAAWHTVRKNRSFRCPGCPDLTGQTFGELTVIRYAGRFKWTVSCRENHEFDVSARRVKEAARHGRKMACEHCLSARLLARPPKRPHKTHGLSKKSRAWYKWMGMRSRCRLRNYSWVCEQWSKFENFLADMGEPPAKTVLDRINNEDGYHPSNCRWANFKLSTENRRNTVWIRFNDRRLRVADFAALIGIKESAVYARIKKGWTPEQIAIKPTRSWVKRKAA